MQIWVRNQAMPDDGLECLGLRGQVGSGFNRNDNGGICDLCGVAGGAADHAENFGAPFLGQFKGADKINADALLCVAAAD